MSAQSWREKFCRHTADEVISLGREDLLAQYEYLHWIGYLPENLKEHGISLRSLTDNQDGHIPDHSPYENPLCVVYRKRDDANQIIRDPEISCTNCLLAKSRGGISCLRPTEKETEAPWYYWVFDRNPMPMIDALEAMLKEYGYL